MIQHFCLKPDLTTMIATLLLGVIATSSVHAQPKNIGADGTTIGTDGDNWFLTTPVSDTTQSFNGGTLRVYDVHIAKMVEITHHQCNTTRSRQDRFWFYRASGGNTNMGQFRISCKLANDLAIAYGMGEPEMTGIFMAEVDEPSYTRIPTLNITGGKVQTWMRFTQNFQPIR